MKEWTKEEIDSVCELVGGNVEEIIRQLQSRLELLEKDNRHLNDGCAELEAQIKSLEKDAERYRWLRANSFYIGGGGMEGPDHPMIRFDFDIWAENRASHTRDGLDSAIDAAMQANKGE